MKLFALPTSHQTQWSRSTFDLSRFNEGFTPNCSIFHDCSLETFTQQLQQLTLDGGIDVEDLSLPHFCPQPSQMATWATKPRHFNWCRLSSQTEMAHSTGRSSTLPEIDPVNFFIITNYESAAEYNHLPPLLVDEFFCWHQPIQLSTDYIVNRPEVKLATTEYLVSSVKPYTLTLPPLLLVPHLKIWMDLDGDSFWNYYYWANY